MFLASGVLYNKEETLKYNKIYLEELKKHKDHKSIVKIAQLRKESNNMTLEEMSKNNNQNLPEFIRLNNILLNALNSLLRKRSVPIEFVIEVISKMELGVNNLQFQDILIETMKNEFETEEDVIIEVINKFKSMLDDY